MLSKGFKKKDIAFQINRHPSTITKEIQRNGSKIKKTMYRANRAQLRADEMKRISRQKARLKNDVIRSYVMKQLALDLTPEQIAGKIQIDLKGYKTNYESIYNFIYKERTDLIKYLVRGRRIRQKRSIKPGKRIVKIPNRVMIENRSAAVNLKKTFGHWEADSIISCKSKSKSSLVVVRERKLQLMYIR